MEYILQFIQFVLHIDKHLTDIVTEYNTYTYLILFLIIFCETGFVVTPLLPGDSLLFAAGTIAGAGLGLNLAILIPLLFIAAFSGDNINYFIGNFIGHKVFEKNYRLINKDYLIKTQKFYEKHGGKTVIIARFIPIVRTFAPFVAGIGSMKYKKFIGFSILGNLLWINLFLIAGFLLCQNEYIKAHFSLVTIGIILISVLPVVISFLRGLMQKKTV